MNHRFHLIYNWMKSVLTHWATCKRLASIDWPIATWSFGQRVLFNNVRCSKKEWNFTETKWKQMFIRLIIDLHGNGSNKQCMWSSSSHIGGMAIQNGHPCVNMSKHSKNKSVCLSVSVCVDVILCVCVMFDKTECI